MYRSDKVDSCTWCVRSLWSGILGIQLICQSFYVALITSVCNEAGQEQTSSHMNLLSTVTGTYLVDQLASLSAQTKSGVGVIGARYRTLLLESGPYRLFMYLWWWYKMFANSVRLFPKWSSLTFWVLVTRPGKDEVLYGTTYNFWKKMYMAYLLAPSFINKAFIIPIFL